MPHAPKPTRADFEDAVIRLGVEPDGEPFPTLASLVGPVIADGRPAFLKVTNEPEELAGTLALQRWDGNGAARLLARDGGAILLERGGRSVRQQLLQDAASTAILCAAIARLHQHSPDDLHGFVTLRRWFASLFADTMPRFEPLRTMADELLDRSDAAVLLHGDVHGENVLEFRRIGTTQWLSIDPKGIVGAREFDYCNIFTNWTPAEAIRHFDARLAYVSETADIDRSHLLRWIVVWSALSGIWHLENGDTEPAEFPHAIMEAALDRLGR